MMEQPEYVFQCAKVGGIMGNKNYPADFIYDNLMIQNQLQFTVFLQSMVGEIKKLKIFILKNPKFPNHSNYRLVN